MGDVFIRVSTFVVIVVVVVVVLSFFFLVFTINAAIYILFLLRSPSQHSILKPLLALHSCHGVTKDFGH